MTDLFQLVLIVDPTRRVLSIMSTFSSVTKVLDFMTRHPQFGDKNDAEGRNALRWGVSYSLLDEEIKAQTEHVIYRGQSRVNFVDELVAARRHMIQAHRLNECLLATSPSTALGTSSAASSAITSSSCSSADAVVASASAFASSSASSSVISTFSEPAIKPADLTDTTNFSIVLCKGNYILRQHVGQWSQIKDLILAEICHTHLQIDPSRVTRFVIDTVINGLPAGTRAVQSMNTQYPRTPQSQSSARTLQQLVTESGITSVSVASSAPFPVLFLLQD